MHIVRFAEKSGNVRTGVLTAETGEIRAFEPSRRIADLLELPAADLRQLIEVTTAAETSHRLGDVVTLPPIDGLTELWAAGVTYRRSREARVEESTEQSVYERVYDARRPELFFKALPWRVVTDAEPIAIRDDSALNVPEPELAVVANRDGEIVGFLVANDVSSRSIEGENPLYLPQAKVYAGSAALSIGIRPAYEISADALGIRMLIRRDGKVVFSGEVSTTELHRSVAELVEFLYAGQPYPQGAVLCTGTGIVPEIGFTLAVDDQVEITIDEVGALTNPVVSGAAPMAWLTASLDRPQLRKKV